MDLIVKEEKKGLYLLKEVLKNKTILTDEQKAILKVACFISHCDQASLDLKIQTNDLNETPSKKTIYSYNPLYQKISSHSYLKPILKEIESTFHSLIKVDSNNYGHIAYFYNDLVVKSLWSKQLLDFIHCFGFIDSFDNHSMTLSFRNSTPLPIEVIAISLNGKIIHQFKEPIQFDNQGTLSFELQSRTIQLKEAIPLKEYSNLVAVSRPIGLNQTKENAIYPWPSFKKENLEDIFMLREPNIEEASYLTIDHDKKTINFKPGKWRLEDDLIIPKGYKVFAGPEVSLDLVKQAVILSYSPFEFKGLKDSPIRIFSSDKTGQGLAILNAKEESHLSYVFFDHLKNPNKKGWTLTSAVTFYESPAQFDHCRFENNICEDSLNMFRSDFTIDHSVFSNTLSDAFDADFSNGLIKNSQFIDCGNDGIDISGSFVQMEKVLLQGIGDKALSSGENSKMEGKDVEIINAELGIASKDLSSIHLHNIKLKDCTVGFTIFQKKPEFGSASVIVENFKEEGVEIPYLLEKKSQLTINEEKIQPNKKNVSDILYGNEYGKSSKR